MKNKSRGSKPLKSRKFKVLQISYMLNVIRLQYIDGSFLYVGVNAHGYTYGIILLIYRDMISWIISLFRSVCNKNQNFKMCVLDVNSLVRVLHNTQEHCWSSNKSDST